LWLEFQPLAAIIILSLIFVLIVERSKITVPIAQNFFKNSIIGIVLGVLWLGSVVAFLLLTNTMNIQGHNNIDFIWIWILAALLNAAMQEFLVRGYLYQLWKQKYNVVVAIVLTTALFTLMHAGAFEAGIIPVLNIVSMSIFVTLLLEYTRTIVAPIIAHFIWNTIGAIILGGVSLAPDYPSLLNSTFQGNSLISGGAYKIEGSIIVSVANLILIACLLVLNKRKRNDNLSSLPQ
ncbi:CPBP family intramembrane glutamic endopeptidase, partial [Pseudogracilibacillus sp. SO30301A]|uniref:CPBP family intramembrane glutamic endopeptidase n=1 Tax=Pseudogracilibacillus sp. SO30301A TaxID=3098291 RepID=UPI00300E2F2B